MKKRGKNRTREEIHFEEKSDGNGNRILMIIKGLFRRYERWNPVHPTSGAFWGMGIGIGCGIGWGPGFGPEVIGYVGAGCGVGFSVGFTLVGVGIGLPANYVIEIPYNATRTSALELARASGFLSTKNIIGDGWNHFAPHVSGLQREASGRLSSFKHKHSLDHGAGLTVMKSSMSCHTRSVLECLGSFRDRCLQCGKGLKDQDKENNSH